MIIVANGGYRTGSTFVFDVVKDLVSGFKFKLMLGLLDHKDILELEDDNTRISVIKSHNWIPPKETNIKTIYTRRLYLDVLSSMKKVGMNHLDHIQEIIHERYREKLMLQRSCLTLEYRDFYCNEIHAVEKISDYIGMSHNLEEIANKFSINNMRKKIKNENRPQGYVKNHISESAHYCNFIENLDPEYIKKAVQEYGE